MKLRMVRNRRRKISKPKKRMSRYRGKKIRYLGRQSTNLTGPFANRKLKVK